MEDLACHMGLPTLDNVIEGCFRPVKLKGCIPRASLEFYRHVVEWFPDHFVFISGGYASYVMGLKADFENVDIYILCVDTDECRDVLEALEEIAKKTGLLCSKIRRPRLDCEYYIKCIRDDTETVSKFSDINVDVALCTSEYHGFRHEPCCNPNGWKRYAKLEESGAVPKSGGRYRYVEMLETVLQFDIFQSMCIIDSVDLKSGQCSAIALHQFQDSVANIDLKSQYVGRRCDKYAKRLTGKKVRMSVTNTVDTPKDTCKKTVSDVCMYKYLTYAERTRYAWIMFEFWTSMQKRYKDYQTKPSLPNPEIVIQSLSNLSLGKILTETRDLDELYEYQRPVMLQQFTPDEYVFD